MRAGLILVAALALTACGARKDLTPAADSQLPVKPATAQATPTPDDLLKPPPQTRPARSGDLIESNKERRSDDFDVPPSN